MCDFREFTGRELFLAEDRSELVTFSGAKYSIGKEEFHRLRRERVTIPSGLYFLCGTGGYWVAVCYESVYDIEDIDRSSRPFDNVYTLRRLSGLYGEEQ